MAERLVRQPAEVELRRLARTLGIAPKRLLGWEPEQRHDHFDADGVLTGWTIVTTEPEWDDDQRIQLIALGRYEAGIHTCGFHRSLTRDKSNRFTFETDHCPVCAGIARYARIQQAADENIRADLKRQHGDQIPPKVADPADGRDTYMRLMPPDQPA